MAITENGHCDSTGPALVTTRDDLKGGLSAPEINQVIEGVILGPR